MTTGKLKWVLILCLFICFLGVHGAFGEKHPEPDKSFDTIEALLDLLKQKGVVNDAEAEKFIRRYKQGTEPAKGKRRVITILAEDKEQEVIEKITRDVTEDVNKDLSKVKDDLDYMSDELQRRARVAEQTVETLEKTVSEDVQNKLYKSSWAQRIRWGGDIRLRFQGDRFDENNAELLKPDNPNELMNTTTDRNRWRYRARLKVKATILDDRETNVGKVEVAARISTGNDQDPVSTNETMGDYYNKDTIVLDQAYIKWDYKPELPMGAKIPKLTLWGGRFPNPWFYTDLVWDNDLNFEGLAMNIQSDTLMSNPWTWFLTLGAFPLQEEEWSQEDKWLYGGQIGVEYKKAMGLSTRLGVAYYDYKNVVGEPNDPSSPNENDFTAPLFQQKGNTLFDIDPSSSIKTALASDYELLNITAQLDYDYWFPIHIILTADYVRNLGFDRSEVTRRTGVDVAKNVDGYQVGLKVGFPKIMYFNEWNAFLFYKYLESDAVLDAFTDSDFHLGGTNAQGWGIGGNYGIYKNVWLTGRWMSTDEVDGPPLAIDTFQVDLNARY